MSQMICQGCGKQTVSCVSRGPSEKEATECFVAWDKGNIVKGCAYNKADELDRRLADEYLEKIKSQKENHVNIRG